MGIAVVQCVFSALKSELHIPTGIFDQSTCFREKIDKFCPLIKFYVFSLIINATKCLFDASTGVAEFASKFFVAAADVDVGSEQVRP